MIKVSIVITVYNIEKYVGECIESVLNQDLKDIELICVDDASTDLSPEIIEKYVYQDERVKLIRLNKNIGPSSARNIGYKEALGEYIYQIDGDDYLVAGALSRLYNCAKENKLDVLTFSAGAIAESDELKKKIGNVSEFYIRKGRYDGIKTGPEMYAQLINNGEHTGNMYMNFINRQFFIDNNLYWLEGLRKSADANLHIYIKAKRTMCIPDVLYMRRFRQDSIVTSPITMIKFESLLVLFAYEFNLWQQYHFEMEIEKGFEKYFSMCWYEIRDTYEQIVDKNVEMQLLPKYKNAQFIYNNYFMQPNRYWTEQTAETIKYIKEFQYIIVYGAKAVARETMKILEKYGLSDYLIAVSDNSYEKTYKNKIVNSIDELSKHKEESIVLIAVSERNQLDIKNKLDELGFRNSIYIR